MILGILIFSLRFEHGSKGHRSPFNLLNVTNRNTTDSKIFMDLRRRDKPHVFNVCRLLVKPKE